MTVGDHYIDAGKVRIIVIVVGEAGPAQGLVGRALVVERCNETRQPLERPIGERADIEQVAMEELQIIMEILVLVVAEQINASAGLGYLINNARDFMRTDIIVVCLMVYAVLGLAADWLVREIERRALVWRPSMVGQ